MSPPGPIEYRDAIPAVRAVFDDIKRTRRVEDVNNFWKYLAHDPASLKRTWESVKEIMTPGALDAVTKEMIYLAVSVTNGCGYCIASHGAAARKFQHDKTTHRTTYRINTQQIMGFEENGDGIRERADRSLSRKGRRIAMSRQVDRDDFAGGIHQTVHDELP